MVNNFTLVFSNTSFIETADFIGTTDIAALATQGDPTTSGNAVALVHEDNNPAVPDLYMLHFTVEAVSGGEVEEAALNTGVFEVTQEFGETTFVFNIGATITTEPNNSTEGVPYQEGIYSGTFEVTAEY